MPVYYVETSALVKRYRFEPGSDVVNELFEGKRADELLITSHFSALEFYAVAARMVQGRVIRQRQYARLLPRFLNDLTDYNVRLIPVSEVLLDEAIDLVSRYALRAPDALHFAAALAARHQLSGELFCLVSGDRELLDACHAYPLDVIDPEGVGAVGQLRAIRVRAD